MKSNVGRLSLMMFLQYAVWGAWLPLAARYLTAPRRGRRARIHRNPDGHHPGARRLDRRDLLALHRGAARRSLLQHRALSRGAARDRRA